MSEAGGNERMWLVYDRECPLCEAYSRMVRIRAAAGELVTVDARNPGPLMDEITAAGLDIDQGMVLKLGERLYYGADAIHALALMSSRSGLFNRLNFLVFRSQRGAALLYPVLRAGRNLVLKLLGRTRINNLGVDGNERF